METDAAITKCVVNIARNLPADTEWSLLVTNNAFDPEPGLGGYHTVRQERLELGI